MESTFGRFDPDGGDGFLRPVFFPQLAKMDELTSDGRRLMSEGGGVRSLPRSIMAQFTTEPGHYGSIVVGSLQEVHFGDDGVVSGRGWLVDVPEAHRLATLIETKALYHNSVDLADVSIEIEWGSDDPKDEAFWEYVINFTEWKVAATTFVNVPAFADAHGTLTEPSEVTASLEPLVVEPAESFFDMHVGVEMEVTAADNPAVPWDDFHRPEARQATAVTIDEHGVVTGHLAAWNRCHEGVDDRCVIAPRPNDYSAFHEPGVHTERGIVETGPIFLLGGHPDRPLGNGDRWRAYGGTENAIADVRVVNGIHGPWLSGRVRPGVSPEALYAARASRVSGHWRRDGTLAAIVCCNVPGYKIPGSTLRADRDGAVIRDAEVVELVASLHAAPHEDAAPDASVQERISQEILQLVNTNSTSGNTITFSNTTGGVTYDNTITFEVDVDCGAVSSHSTATSSGSWDGPANEKKLDSPMPVGTARKAYAWIDDGEVSDGQVVKAACKFIHHEVSGDGTPGAANLTACSTGIGVLNGGRGGTKIPDSDRQGVYNHLAKHLRDGGQEPPELMSTDDIAAALALELELQLQS